MKVYKKKLNEERRIERSGKKVDAVVVAVTHSNGRNWKRNTDIVLKIVPT